MALPVPVPGLVISYAYLWHREHLAGRDEGLKSRPCAIVAALRQDEAGLTRVLVVPITHRAPTPETPALELPPLVKSRLGLDEALSWIVLSEWNDFVWPGPDLTPIANKGSFAYGMLPPSLFRALQVRFLALAKKGVAKRVYRED